jgi:hypothetical protein
MILTLFADNLKEVDNVFRVWVEGASPTIASDVKVYFSESAGVIANSVNQTGTIDTAKIPIDTYNDIAIAIAKAHTEYTVDSIRDIVQEASDDAGAALEYLDGWASDGVLSQIEKKSLRSGMEIRFAEYLDIKNQALSLGLTTQATALQNALDVWGTYLNGGASWNPPASTPITNTMMPLWIKDANLSTNQTINRTAFNSAATTYFDSLIAVKTAIANKLNSNVSTAGTTADWSNIRDDNNKKPADNADQTYTAIQNGIISTGSIGNTAGTLHIDFNTATITVKSARGLLINSVGGLYVSGSGSIYLVDAELSYTILRGKWVKLAYESNYSHSMEIGTGMENSQLTFSGYKYFAFLKGITGFGGYMHSNTRLAVSAAGSGDTVAVAALFDGSVQINGQTVMQSSCGIGGTLVCNSGGSARSVKCTTISSSGPSTGSDGDVWLQY